MRTRAEAAAYGARRTDTASAGDRAHGRVHDALVAACAACRAATAAASEAVRAARRADCGGFNDAKRRATTSTAAAASARDRAVTVGVDITSTAVRYDLDYAARFIRPRRASRASRSRRVRWRGGWFRVLRRQRCGALGLRRYQ